MDVSEREDQPSSDIEDDVECKKVSKKIASVTLESDSMPESPKNGLEERVVRRKKRMRRINVKGLQMDVDPYSKKHDDAKYMDCDGAESHISSSDESISEDNRGGEADDEQSDWVGDTTPSKNPIEGAPFDRKMFLRKSQSSHHVSSIQKKIERFSKEGGRGELVLDLRFRDRSTTALLYRYIYKYHLEIVHRHRSSVTLRKRIDIPSTSIMK